MKTDEKNLVNIIVNVNKTFFYYQNVLIYSILKKTDRNIMLNLVLYDKSENYNFEILEKIKSKNKNFSYRLFYETEVLKNARSLLESKDQNVYSELLEKGTSYKFRWIRFLYPLFLKDVEKAIYLDVDLIFRKDIGILYDKLNDDFIVGAKEHRVNFFLKLNKDKKQFFEKNYKGKWSEYINSGVLLLNLKRMRDENYSAQLFNWVYENELKNPMFEKPKFVWDQDAINCVFYDQISHFSISWNFVKGNFYRLVFLFNKKYVIHWTGKNKPWNSKWYYFVRYARRWKKIERKMKKELL